MDGEILQWVITICITWQFRWPSLLCHKQILCTEDKMTIFALFVSALILPNKELVVAEWLRSLEDECSWGNDFEAWDY